MADDPKKEDPKEDPKKDDPAKGDPDPDDGLGDAGKRALTAERRKAREAEKKAKELEDRLAEIEDKDKTEGERLAGKLSEAEKRAEAAEAKVLRMEIAAEKGVKARWLSGTTREELEAAADEYLEDHPQSEDGAKPPPSRKPATDLKGGADPTEEPAETDPAKLAANVPRY